MLRFITMLVLAFQTSSTGMPAMGLVGSSCKAALTTFGYRDYQHLQPECTFSRCSALLNCWSISSGIRARSFSRAKYHLPNRPS